MKPLFVMTLIGLLAVGGARAAAPGVESKREMRMACSEQNGADAQRPPSEGKKAEKTLDISGAMSGIRQPRQVVIRDAKAFEKLWKEHTTGTSLPMPPVDFKKYDVVAVFAGSKTTGGYQVILGEIKRSGKTATVHATLLKPGPGMMVTQAFTYPFAMRAVPKLPPTVKFTVVEKFRS
jgi:hypothetical protein